jgi:nitrogen regulatory protein P-II 1
MKEFRRNVMAFKKVIAILQCTVLEKVESALQEIGVPGISVTYIKGYGDYSNFFQSPPLVKHAQIEIFTDEKKVDLIISTIMQNAHTGLEGDGLVTIIPVEHIYRITTQSEIKSFGTADP